jgi:sugar-specific transcriptional regulator TrmB
VLGGAAEAEATSDDARALAASLLAAGESPSRAAKEVARRLRIPRNQAYSLVQDLTGGGTQTEE